MPAGCENEMHSDYSDYLDFNWKLAKGKAKGYWKYKPTCNTRLDFSVSIGDFPSICYPEIVNYLAFSFTENSTENGQCEAYKRLEVHGSKGFDKVKQAGSC